MLENDTFYMRRALELARHGQQHASPNPMVGAVIVAPDGRIIGEGWHRRCGKPHAEVNAIDSVSRSDRHLIPLSTIYVTLEPCSHYGKTPPCALLLVRERVRRVVVATLDPFPKVAGRGIAMLREAGIEVTVGILEKEALELNRRFMTAHRLQRPYITLKWAQSTDGFMDSLTRHPMTFSTRLTQTLVHRLRSLHDGIITSARTANADNPRLDVRLWPWGDCPRPVILYWNTPPSDDLILLKNTGRNTIAIDCRNRDLTEVMHGLYASHKLTSVLVEAGPKLLDSFIKAGLWDEIRIEVSPLRLGEDGIHHAPEMPGPPDRIETICRQNIYYKSRI
ncbi:MAG: bifunctional diaminohydroxyphosphoribosylaminopyrimidine deaminase/5-amino-6-(5-phosphoribosylamino)uracil reductase RibD [Muribaculaceae bacterium]|nr:bifunctional diaminohydroxyphosphoribosylaminopyrimidine deaminase/5-amino-6-(5-phosphoribosylamino)uracil reductase RibD [Muribaculaceae bacterium]MDE6609164.1 bifunctional diaminohydroxyphosphoribosylaminopyrimidine deaminase/5-amino-6-(5-phosphoribosylamino)uracil reductase RibD [Muribaculaceae bacterium]